MYRAQLQKTVLELIRRTSAFLPPDVAQVLAVKRAAEAPGSRADLALELIERNIGLAKALSAPICQDTGTINFYIHAPVGADQLEVADACRRAVVEATERGYLRQNSVDSLSGKNTGNNLGPGSPLFHWEQTRDPNLDIRLILKGGGCENMSAQYSLPAQIAGRRADRNLEGVRACILDAVCRAQGKGCSPGFLGVCIGGDRAGGYEAAKRQLLRPLDDANDQPELAALEQRILEEANTLEIGPMGFGGSLTLGGCKIGAINRLPACYFVSVAYMCWAYRRRGVVVAPSGEVVRWLYHAPGEFEQPAEAPPAAPLRGEAISLSTPLSEQDVRKLKAGDMVLLSGVVTTARDAVHKYLFDGGELDEIRGGVIYHCGPVILQEGDQRRVVAAGPTTSIREEPYQADIIRRFNVRAVIGKGGMGEQTRRACQEHGCVYLHAIGGAAQIYAQCVQRVLGVSLEQFGSPEAAWRLEVRNFPAIVTMDAHGESLHGRVGARAEERLSALVG